MAEERMGGLSDPTKINPYRVPEGKLDEYQQTLKDQITALEQRYQNPNWFKVAAGFAKPQLGGFLASLGSASEALGENVEQQRAQMLPIAQMKAQLSQAEIAMGQNKMVSEMVAKRRADNLPITPEFVAEITAIAPDSAVAKSLASHLGVQQKQQEITSAQQTNAIQAIRLAREAGRTISPEMYIAAGLPPPGTTINSNIPKVDGQMPNENLPSQSTSSAISPPLPIKKKESNSDETKNEPEKLYVLPNGARAFLHQYKLYQQGVPIISGHRTQEEQDQLKYRKDENNKWWTKEGLPVADSASTHLTGNAIDVDTRKLNKDHIKILEDSGYHRPYANDPGHWELKTAAKGEIKAPEKPKERIIINSNNPIFTPIFTEADAANVNKDDAAAINKTFQSKFDKLSSIGNSQSYAENEHAVNSMIETLEKNKKQAEKVVNPLGRQTGLLGGIFNTLEAGMGFNVQGLAGNINIPISKFINGLADEKDKTLLGTLNSQAARIAQIQQQLNNVNPSSIRSGEIEMYKNSSVNPNSQFTDVMLYNLYYTRENNRMIKEMYDRANKILKNEDPNYQLNPNSSSKLYDILTSPAMDDIHKKYQKEFADLNKSFQKRLSSPPKQYVRP